MIIESHSSFLPKLNMSHNLQRMLVEDFLEQLSFIPWFSKVGQTTSEDYAHKQIHGWDEWPGPEEESVLTVNLREQALFDRIFAESDQIRRSLEHLWREIVETVVRIAAATVPFDPNGDAWHAPSTAVWHAAWTAGLVGLHLMLKKTIPEDIQVQWNCFKSGHWPFGWEGEFPKGKLLIY